MLLKNFLPASDSRIVPCRRPGERRRPADRDGSDSEDSFTGSFSSSMHSSGVSGARRQQLCARSFRHCLSQRL